MRSIHNCLRVVRDVSFNEAEARTPRMLRRCAGDGAVDRIGFNEAEARTPRMRLANETIAASHTSASMRPRRARLGCRSSNASQILT